LRISDETMDKILVGGAVISVMALTAAIVALVLDDSSGFGAFDDAAIPAVVDGLKGYIMYLFEYFGILQSMTPCSQ